MVGRWEQGLELLEKMKSRRVAPNVVTYNSCISACAKSFQWQQALNLLEDMNNVPIRPDLVTFHSVIKACTGNRGAQLKQALVAFRKMESLKVKRTPVTYGRRIILR